jgi:hypothetical protein
MLGRCRKKEGAERKKGRNEGGRSKEGGRRWGEGKGRSKEEEKEGMR